MTDINWYDEDAATFGDRLAAAREGVGMSQSELAKRIGVKSETLSAWENDLKEPRANRLSMLSGLLGISLSWLLTGKGDGPQPPEDELEEADPDTEALLAEMRALRVQISQNAQLLGRLEKRLRQRMKAA